jgi:hypothetical protein
MNMRSAGRDDPKLVRCLTAALRRSDRATGAASLPLIALRISLTFEAHHFDNEDMPRSTSHELIVTIVRALAEAADRSRLTNEDQILLNTKVEELMAYDSDESVREILSALKYAPLQHSALTQGTVEKLRQRY